MVKKVLVQNIFQSKCCFTLSRPDEDDGIDVQDSNEENVPEKKPPSVIKKNKE